MNRQMAKMNLSLFWIFVLLYLMSQGCAYTDSVQFDSIVREPKPDDFPIEILDKDDIERAYKVIGYVNSSGGEFNVDSYAINNLKKNARKMGGDALIDLKFLSENYIYEAKVIVWENP